MPTVKQYKDLIVDTGSAYLLLKDYKPGGKFYSNIR